MNIYMKENTMFMPICLCVCSFQNSRLQPLIECHHAFNVISNCSCSSLILIKKNLFYFSFMNSWHPIDSRWLSLIECPDAWNAILTCSCINLILSKKQILFDFSFIQPIQDGYHLLNATILSVQWRIVVALIWYLYKNISIWYLFQTQLAPHRFRMATIHWMPQCFKCNLEM